MMGEHKHVPKNSATICAEPRSVTTLVGFTAVLVAIGLYNIHKEKNTVINEGFTCLCFKDLLIIARKIHRNYHFSIQSSNCSAEEDIWSTTDMLFSVTGPKKVTQHVGPQAPGVSENYAKKWLRRVLIVNRQDLFVSFINTDVR
jgi:hypothetical protein